MTAKSESGLRRALDRLGYRLHRKDDLYCITSVDAGGVIHAYDYHPHSLDLGNVRGWVMHLAE